MAPIQIGGGGLQLLLQINKQKTNKHIYPNDTLKIYNVVLSVVLICKNALSAQIERQIITAVN